MKKNKLVILDLDGVLIDSRDLHYYALNDALSNIGNEYIINREEHLSTYDGLSTTKKLKMLTLNKGLDPKYYDKIWKDKQEATLQLISDRFDIDDSLCEIVKKIKDRDYYLAVASNSIRETLKLCLIKIGIIQYIDYFVSNEDVMIPKPYPEMYWKCMSSLKVLPKNTIIIEDSHIGRRGAIDSGAHLFPVENSYEFINNKTLERLFDMMDKIEGISENNLPWRDNKLNVVIPMAGAGSRFTAAGYTFPKPLIEVNGKPMIQVVVENLNIEANYIFIVQKEHYEKYNLQYLLNLIVPNCKIIQTEGITEGAACTTLLAKEYIDNDSPLVMANSDQFIIWNSNECMYSFYADSIDGGILTFPASHPRWSFAKLGTDGFVSEVAEKKVISDKGTCGIYFWKKGSDYVKYAQQMISKNIRVNNEFYVCPVFNEAIQDGKKIRAKNIEKMYGIGTPEDLNYFLKTHK